MSIPISPFFIASIGCVCFFGLFVGFVLFVHSTCRATGTARSEATRENFVNLFDLQLAFQSS